MALTQDVIRTSRGTGNKDVISIKTGEQLYVGSAVSKLLTTGRAVIGQGTTRRTTGVALRFLGPNADGLGVADGTEEVEVGYDEEYEFDVLTAIRTNSHLGLNVFWSSDDKVGGTAVGTAGVQVNAGRLVAFTNSSKSKAFIAVTRFSSATIAV